jgi:hypothetical protein
VLQRLVGFVGFHRSALVAIFAGAFLPLLDIELKPFALFEAVDLGFLGGGEGGAGLVQS